MRADGSTDPARATPTVSCTALRAAVRAAGGGSAVAVNAAKRLIALPAAVGVAMGAAAAASAGASAEAADVAGAGTGIGWLLISCRRSGLSG